MTGCGDATGYEVAHSGQTRYLTVILIVCFALDGTRAQEGTGTGTGTGPRDVPGDSLGLAPGLPAPRLCACRTWLLAGPHGVEAGPGAGWAGRMTGGRGFWAKSKSAARSPRMPAFSRTSGRGSGRPSVLGLSRAPFRKSSSMNLLKASKDSVRPPVLGAPVDQAGVVVGLAAAVRAGLRHAHGELAVLGGDPVGPREGAEERVERPVLLHDDHDMLDLVDPVSGAGAWPVEPPRISTAATAASATAPGDRRARAQVSSLARLPAVTLPAAASAFTVPPCAGRRARARGFPRNHPRWLLRAAPERPRCRGAAARGRATSAATTPSGQAARKSRPRSRTGATGRVLVTGFRCLLLMGFPFPPGLRRRRRSPCCGADAGEQPLQGEPEQVVGNPGGVQEPLPGQAVILHRPGQAQDLGGVSAGRCRHVHQAHLPSRDGAGLVQHDHVDGPGGLQHLP